MMKSAAPVALAENLRISAERQSPNHDDRKLPCDLVIVHYTDMPTAQDAMERLCDPASKVSAHFLITEAGDVHALVDPAQRAWHAGVSSWQGVSDVNSRSIGIELANPGHSNGYRPFPAEQIDALCALLRRITTTLGIAPSHILGHSDIAPLRKQDPGALFPWKTLAERGFGFWPTEPLAMPASLPPVSEMQRQLACFGYACPASGLLDADTRAVFLAFQRHFQPDQLTGIPDLRTAAILAGLL